MLDGAARLTEMFDRTAELGMGAIAMTDHGNVFGAFDFYSKATAAGVKPIIGMEAYLTPNTSRFDRKRVRWNNGGDDDVSGSGAYTHMTLLAENNRGMNNLFRLSSRSSIEGFFYKPRADRELLAQHAEGLIGTTGCPSGEVQTWLRIGDYDKARAAAGDFQDIFGRDSFFLELMDHGLSIETRVRDGLLRLSKDLGIPPIATNDSHYTNPADAPAHEHLLCVSSGSTMADPKRFKFSGDSYYIKSPAEMRELWGERHGLPEACDNTLLIAERCDVSFDESANYMPRFPVPAGETEDTWFVKEVEKGLAYRYPDGVTPEVRKQADFEIGVITQMGFPGYFLVVADFINWAKDNGIRVGPGRGSGAGSMAAYAMRITDLDPLAHGLIFERFLNPDRVSMPDFDIDFDERRRGEVIRYVSDKYGDDRVSMIVTYGTIKAKQAVKDSSRILGYPFAMGDRITKAMPAAVMGKDVPLREIFDQAHAPLRRGRRVPLAVRRRRRRQEGRRHRHRHRGPQAAVGRARRRRDHVQRAAAGRHPGDEAGAGRRDHHAVRLPDLRAPRPDQDGLPGAAQPHDPRRRAGQHHQQPRREDRPRGPDPRRPDDVRAARQRATPSACSSSTAARCGRCCAACVPTRFEDISAVGALYRPGPMGADSHNKYARRKNGREEVDADPPGAGRAARGHPGGDLRPDRLPGAGHGDRPEARGLLAGPGGHPAPRDGQEEEGRAGQAVRGLLRGHGRARLLHERRADAVGHPAAVLRLRLQQGALGGVRPGVVLDRLPQGQLPGRVHGRRPHVRQGRQGQDGDLPQRVPADEDPGAAAGRQRVGGDVHAGRRRHPVRAVRDPQRRHQRRRRRGGRAARAGPVHRLRRLHGQGLHRWCATSGSWSR